MFDYGKANNQNQFNKTLEAIISHIGHNYRQPGNIITSIRNEQEVIIPLVPTPKFQDESDKDDDKARLAKAANRAADLEYVEQIKARNKEKEMLKENIQAAYSLVWGQCTVSMQAQIKTMSSYAAIRDRFAVFDLL